MNFYETPIFVDIVLTTIYVLLAVTVGLCLWSLVRGLRHRERTTGRLRAARRLGVGVGVLLVATLGLTYGLASTEPLLINGEAFTDTFWLRVSDMLINSSLVLMIIAIVCVAFGMSGISRRLN